VGVKVQIQSFLISALDRGDNQCLRAGGGGIRYKLPGPSGPEEGLGPGPNMSNAFLSFSIVSHVIRQCFVALTTLSARGYFAYDAVCFISLLFLCRSALAGRVRTNSPWLW
jgi:hypothetical protein